MLVEERTYTTHPGKYREYLALYEAEGLEIQHRILGRMAGYYYSDIGDLNQIVHLWAYESLDERPSAAPVCWPTPGSRPTSPGCCRCCRPSTRASCARHLSFSPSG